MLSSHEKVFTLTYHQVLCLSTIHTQSSISPITIVLSAYTNVFREKCFQYYSSSSTVQTSTKTYSGKHVKDIGKVSRKYTFKTKHETQTNEMDKC